MSRVANVILTQKFPASWETERLKEINKYFDSIGIRGLVSVEETGPDGPGEVWYGGNKGLECCIAIGAFNGLDVDGFLSFLRNEVGWDAEKDGTCQVFILNEGEWEFTSYKVYVAD